LKEVLVLTLYLNLKWNLTLNSTLKKCILLSLIVAAFIIWAESAAGAADTVGVVNSQKILFQHPGFDDATRILLYLSRPTEGNPITLIESEKDADTKRLLTKFIDLITEFSELDRALAAEKDLEKKTRLSEARQEKLAQREGELMTPILQECRKVLETVMKNKKMTVVLEVGSVYLGGTDITEDVIQQLKGGKK
jgi:outer membrane protein